MIGATLIGAMAILGKRWLLGHATFDQQQQFCGDVQKACFLGRQERMERVRKTQLQLVISGLGFENPRVGRTCQTSKPLPPSKSPSRP